MGTMADINMILVSEGENNTLHQRRSRIKDTFLYSSWRKIRGNYGKYGAIVRVSQAWCVYGNRIARVIERNTGWFSPIIIIGLSKQFAWLVAIIVTCVTN